MKGRDILQNYLTSSERKEWERNAGPNTVRWMLNNEYYGLWEFINRSFIMSETPEGFDYWDNIANREGLVKKTLPKFIL